MTLSSTSPAILVIAAGRIGGAREETGLEPTARELERHLAGRLLPSVITVAHDVVYGIMPLSESSESSVAQAVSDISDFVHSWDAHGPWCAGLGGPGMGTRSVPASKQAAERVLDLLRTSSPEPRVALFSDVVLQVALHELGSRLAEEGAQATGPVAELARHDQENGTDLLGTLRQWLMSFGNASAAARSMGVARTTFRRRLDQAVNLSGLDLGDPEARLDAELQLRLFHPRQG
jgi:sugar diacid utilization regulator